MKIHIWGYSPLSLLVWAFFGEDQLTDDPEEADYHISCQYNEIFTKEEIDRYGYILNIHFSDTSVMRGCNPMSHAIENGMKQTMVTFHVIDEGTDTGPVVMKVPVNIRKKDTAWTLYNRCTSMAFGAFRDNWGMLKLKPPGEPQKSLGSYYTRDLDNELFLYEWQKRFIRSRTFPDKPCPYLVIDGRRVEL